MDRLMELKRGGEDDPDFGRALGGREGARPRAARAGGRRGGRPIRTCPSRSPDRWRPTTPCSRRRSSGAGSRKGIALDDIAAYLNETALFRNQWGYRPDKSRQETDADFKDRIRADAAGPAGRGRRPPACSSPRWPRATSPVNSDGDDLVVWKDDARTSEWLRFTFPRQREEPWLCIADFFRPVGVRRGRLRRLPRRHHGRRGSSEETARLFADDHYQDYLHLHGLGVEMTEALAEYWHRRIREEWGFADEDGPTLGGLFRQQYRGGRYSWGYPACPDLEDNAKVRRAARRRPHRRRGQRGDFWQLHPEQTTAAIICHHPQAKYFVGRAGLIGRGTAAGSPEGGPGRS